MGKKRKERMKRKELDKRSKRMKQAEEVSRSRNKTMRWIMVR
jgi:hypothetical protein